MCKRPCWPTPKEAQDIIDAGFGDKLMLDYWAGDNNVDIYILCGATPEREGKKAEFLPHGGCVFQMENRLCFLHDLGLKPIEGRVADCKLEPLEGEITVHERVAMLWDSDLGCKVVEEWRDDYYRRKKCLNPRQR